MKSNLFVQVRILALGLFAISLFTSRQTFSQYFSCIKIDRQVDQKACFYEKEKMCQKMGDTIEKMRCEEQIARKHDICNHQDTLKAIEDANVFAKSCVSPDYVDGPDWTLKVRNFFESPNKYRHVYDNFQGCPRVSQMDYKLCNEAPHKFKQAWNKKVEEFLKDSKDYYEPKIKKLRKKAEEAKAIQIAKKQIKRGKEILDLMAGVGDKLGDGSKKAVEGALKEANAVLEKVKKENIAKYKKSGCPNVENSSKRLAKKFKAQGEKAATVFGENGKTKVLKVDSEYKQGRDYQRSKDYRDYKAVICVEAQGEMKEILEEKQYPTCFSQQIIIRHLNDMYVEKWGDEFEIIAPNPLETIDTKTLPISCKKMR